MLNTPQAVLHQWLSLVISGYLGYQWLSVVIVGYQWLSLVISGYRLVWSYHGYTLVISGYRHRWLSEVVVGYRWLCICYTMPSRDLCKIHEGMFDKPEGVARGFITHSRVFLHRSLEGMV